MGSEKLKALCESIQKEDASPLVKQLIALLEERGLLTPIVMRDWTGINPWPDVLVYHRARGWSAEEIHRMRLNGDDSIHESESCGGGSSFSDSSSGQRSGGRSGGSAWVAEGKAIIDKDRREHPLKERLRGNVGCQPGQFNDIDWRKGT